MRLPARRETIARLARLLAFDACDGEFEEYLKDNGVDIATKDIGDGVEERLAVLPKSGCLGAAEHPLLTVPLLVEGTQPRLEVVLRFLAHDSTMSERFKSLGLSREDIVLGMADPDLE